MYARERLKPMVRLVIGMPDWFEEWNGLVPSLELLKQDASKKYVSLAG